MPAPVDQRLVRESRAARSHLGAAAALGGLEAGLIVAQAVLLATIIARAVVHGAGLSALSSELVALGAVVVARALVRGGFELSGLLGATRVMSELRGRLVEHLIVRAPGQRAPEIRTGDLATAAVQGVEALEAYFAGYLPQLMLASVVPVAVLVVAALNDPIAALILAITIPILILFMILVGKGTQAASSRRLGALSLLSSHFLDVVRGLATLRAYRRERVQEGVLAAVGDRYRHETLATLRIAFLSALVLELCAMLGTAVVAATIGVQLVGGHLSLQAGLLVLLLAPELYNPLRAVGQQFHASADGTAAAERIFAALSEPVAVQVQNGGLAAPDPRLNPVALRGVTFEYPGRPGAVLREVSLELAPGSFTALVGPSGSGKSTLSALLMRLIDPTAGAITCGARDLRELDLEAWRARLAWVPQMPTIFAGSVADNILLGASGRAQARLADAVRAAGLEELVAELPQGLGTVIGVGGRRLSAGQRQRVALARAFVRDASQLLLDAPTSHLDASTAAAVGEAIERVARGRTTLMIAHHEGLARRADHAVRLQAGAIVTSPAALRLVAA